MNTLLLSINWNPNPELFNLFGLSIRYYELLWAVGIFLAYVIVHYQYRDKKIDEKKFDPLFFYCFFGILIGARLGHCLFYDPGQCLANLMNSEIIGKPSDVPWAFIFERVDMQPRHPGQLYEAIAYLILFFIMIYLYKNYSKKLHRGFFFGLCLTYIFVFRFFIEFLKENQEDFENNMMFNMGQWLSIPFVIVGIYFMFFYDRKKKVA